SSLAALMPRFRLCKHVATRARSRQRWLILSSLGRGEHLLPHRLLVALLPLGASAAGLPPWRVGMSKAEVVSFHQLDPYKPFSNGDVQLHLNPNRGAMWRSSVSLGRCVVEQELSLLENLCFSCK